MGIADAAARRAGDAEVVREVFDKLPLMVVGVQGPDHRFVATTAAYREYIGRTELDGVPVREAIPEAVDQRVFDVLDRVYATGTPETASEWRIQLDRGAGREESWIDFFAAPRRGADGVIAGVTVYLVDVTRRVSERQAARRQAAESERRYQAAREVVAGLQEALLPTSLPVLPSVRIAASYLVAAQDQAAGGDWFDAIPLPGGGVALVLGDVVGHGIAASAAMGQLRAVLKHVLVTEPDLAAALAAADRFAADEPALHVATVCVAVLDPASGGLRYATCGHPPPLLVTLDGTARFLPVSGAGPLGIGPAPTSAPTTLASATLAPGELVLLYSDGLIERPGRTPATGMAELAVVAGDAAAGRSLADDAAPPERVCQQVVELLTRTGYSDDVTTLAAWRHPAPVPALDQELPAELSTVTALCGAMDRWLEQSGAIVNDRQAVWLAVTETVANAIEHAYPPGQPGPVRLEAAIDGRAYLEIRVSDQGRWRPPDPAETQRGHGLMLAEYLAASMTITHPHGEADGTTVTLRYRLRRPAMLGSQPGITLAAAPPAAPFTAELVTGGAAPRVRVAGPVDITTEDRFAGRLLAACRGGVMPLTVDLTGVTVLASAGVRALHRIRAQLTAHRHDLALIAADASAAAAVLDLVRLPRTSAAGAAGPDQHDSAPAASGQGGS